MSWNGSNDNNKKKPDPWGSSNQDQPPDIDELIKKLQDWIKRTFSDQDGGGSSGGSSGGSGGSAPAIGGSFFLILFVFVLIAYVAMGFYVVDEQEQAVVFRLGAVMEVSESPGLHWNPPLIDDVRLVNVTRVREINHRTNMLTKDLNFVLVSVAVQWVIADPSKYLVKVSDPESSLVHATESAVRHVVANLDMELVMTKGRIPMAQEIEVRTQRSLDEYGTGILISSVNVNETLPPQEVKAAFDDVQKAKEDKARIENEALAYAEALIPEARGKALRILEDARGYKDRVVSEAKGQTDRFLKLLSEYRKAPEVTRDRIYLDTVESVLSKTTKVMVDLEGSGNLLYLPLDQMLSRPKVPSAAVEQRDHVPQNQE